jgi:L-asparaginase
MKNILLVNTGGTFNKVYDPLSGELPVDTTATALEDIASRWLCDFEITNIIGKDSLHINSQDRLLLLATINLSEHDDIIIVHGTDTMHITAEYLADADLDKRIVLTGAMVPYAIDPVEATANLASAFGYLQKLDEDGIYIAMNGVFGPAETIEKEREVGKFVYK